VFTYLCTVAGIDFKTDNMHKAGLLFFSRLYIPFGFDTFYPIELMSFILNAINPTVLSDLDFGQNGNWEIRLKFVIY